MKTESFLAYDFHGLQANQYRVKDSDFETRIEN